MITHFNRVEDSTDGTTSWFTREAFTSDMEQPEYHIELHTQDYKLYEDMVGHFKYKVKQLEKERGREVDEF